MSLPRAEQRRNSKGGEKAAGLVSAVLDWRANAKETVRERERDREIEREREGEREKGAPRPTRGGQGGRREGRRGRVGGARACWVDGCWYGFQEEREGEGWEQRVVGALLIPVCADWAKRRASGSAREREGAIYSTVCGGEKETPCRSRRQILEMHSPLTRHAVSLTSPREESGDPSAMQRIHTWLDNSE